MASRMCRRHGYKWTSGRVSDHMSLVMKSTHTHTHTRAHTHAHTRPHRFRSTHTHTHTHTQIQKHTHTHTHMHTHTHTHAHTHTHTRTHTHTHAHTHTHTHAHTHTHTHTHTDSEAIDEQGNTHAHGSEDGSFGGPTSGQNNILFFALCGLFVIVAMLVLWRTSLGQRSSHKATHVIPQ